MHAIMKFLPPLMFFVSIGRWGGALVAAAASVSSVHVKEFAHRSATQVGHRHHRRHLRHHRRHRHHRHHHAKGDRNSAGTDSLRPIITGCLDQCGYEDQSCVTQCQVCVEEHRCRILRDCEHCVRDLHVAKLWSARTDKTVLDGGGVAMMRDGLLAEMTRARLEALDRKRELRSAREEVLKAQREAEWSSEERHLSAKKLNETRHALKGARQDISKWKLQNAKKLKAMRTQAREERQQQERAERRLEKAQLKYDNARKRLRIASNDSIANGEEVWTAAQEVKKRKDAVVDAENALEKSSADGEWLDRGLRQRVKRAQKNAKNSREELLEGRVRERVSHERLEETKALYEAAVLASKGADKVAELSEEKLRRAPTSQDTLANTTQVTVAKPLRQNKGANFLQRLVRKPPSHPLGHKSVVQSLIDNRAASEGHRDGMHLRKKIPKEASHHNASISTSQGISASTVRAAAFKPSRKDFGSNLPHMRGGKSASKSVKYDSAVESLIDDGAILEVDSDDVYLRKAEPRNGEKQTLQHSVATRMGLSLLAILVMLDHSETIAVIYS